MPDWIIHIGAAHALGRPLARWDPRWLFLGAVLPDAIPRVFSMTVHMVRPLNELMNMWVGLHVGFFHTPVSVVLLAAALVVLAADRVAAARGLAFGAGLHFVLDLLQKSWGGGTSVLYPFDLRPWSLQVVWYDSSLPHLLVGGFLVYLVVLCWRSSWPRDAVFAPWSRARGLVSGALIAVYLAMPALCLDRAVALNLGNSRMALEPAEFEGRTIQVAVAVVDHVEGDDIVIERADELFPVTWAERSPLAAADFVSIRGVFRGGRIEPTEVFVHDYRFKMFASLGGLVVLLLVWAPSLRPRRS